MPVTPSVIEGLAQATVDRYSEAERVLLERIAKALAAGIDEPGWADRKLLEVQLLQARAQALLDVLGTQAGQAVAKAILTAWNRGSAVAAGDLAELLDRALSDVVDPLPGSPALTRLAAETTQIVTSTHARILRSTMDAYRQVVAEVSGQVLLGTQTRREAAQAALDRFAARGVTGFIDKAGRGWDMASYVEMAVRTSTQRAAVAAQVDRLQAYGQDLVIVSDAPQECPTCRPWEGKVLSLSGRTAGTIQGGRGARVAGTLPQATADGLFHPGCRHSVSAYLPGVTKAPRATADPEGDAARQRLRYLERQVRAAKRQEAAALDDAAAARARARVRELQGRIREHVATTSAKRQPAREQIGRAR